MRNRKYGRPTQKQSPVSFEKWFLQRTRKCEKNGAKFELLEPGMVKIMWPGKSAIFRTKEEFKRVQKNYLSKFSF